MGLRTLALVVLLLGTACTPSDQGSTQPRPDTSEPQSPAAPVASETDVPSPERATQSFPSAESAPPRPVEETPGSEPLATDFFRTPSGNIRCGITGTGPGVECAISSGLNPEPTEEGCDLDWRGLHVSDEEVSPSCGGDPAPVVLEDPGTLPVLEYGRTWSRDGIVCRSEKTGLTCTNEDGRGFFLSRARWETF